jgi:hypothetical protein
VASGQGRSAAAAATAAPKEKAGEFAGLLLR